MSFKVDHPEQDPAEGSRKVIDRELARQREMEQHTQPRTETAKDETRHKPAAQEHRPM